MKLWYVPRTRSTRPRWVLEELGLAHELGRLDAAKGETRSAEHLRRHPLGHVPVLEDGDVTIFESAAICLYLAERYGAGRLLPREPAARAPVYQWMFFGVSEVEAPLAQLSALTRGKHESEWDRAALEPLRARVADALRAVERAVAQGGHVAGPDFTVADVLLGSLLAWASSLKALPASDALRGYLDGLRARPAFRRAVAD